MKKIVTVTLNPAIDKTVFMGMPLDIGGLNRVQKVVLDIGGKGINVSKMIAVLGGKSVAVGFIGGAAGMQMLRGIASVDSSPSGDVLGYGGIAADFIEVAQETRTNLKVLSPEANGFTSISKVTEINEPGGTIKPSEMLALEKKLLDYADEHTIFVFAGSIPSGVDCGIYAKLIHMVKAKGAEVLLDADGAVFSAVLNAQVPPNTLALPDYIKPNKYELIQYFQHANQSGE